MVYRPRGEQLIRGTCLVEGCGRLQRGRGKDKHGQRMYDRICDKHHKLRHNLRDPFAVVDGKAFLGLKHVPNKKCERCGWEGPCDRHRLIPEKGYTPGNVMILCPNCHRLVTLKLLTL